MARRENLHVCARVPVCMPVCMALALLVSAPAATAARQLDVAFNVTDASFEVSVAGSRWLRSAPLRAFAGGAWGALARTGAPRTTNGTDALGEFRCTNVSWTVGHTVVLHTSLKTYGGENQNLAVFVQQLPHGATGTNASNPVLPGNLRVMDPGNYPPVVAFPSFAATPKLEALGYE